MKPTRKEIAAALGFTERQDWDKSGLTLHRGVFTLRLGYYYRPPGEVRDRFAPFCDKLMAAGYSLLDVEYGDHWAPFRGGDTIKQGSHFWMKFRPVGGPKRKD